MQSLHASLIILDSVHTLGHFAYYSIRINFDNIIWSLFMYVYVVHTTCNRSPKNKNHDVASGRDITPCNKIDRPLVVYIFRNVT